MLKVLETYLEALADKGARHRGEWLAGCLTPDAAVQSHSQVFGGHAEISEDIAELHGNFPDCRRVLASGPFGFESIVRPGNAIVGADGSVVARGETVTETAADGRIRHAAPLRDTTLPPPPDARPERPAVPLVPNAPNAA